MVKSFARSQGLDYPILLDTFGLTGAEYGVRGIPTILLLDRHGIIRYQAYQLPDPSTITALLR